MIFETYLAIRASSSPEKEVSGEHEKRVIICMLEGKGVLIVVLEGRINASSSPEKGIISG